jgi:hypothetical protein
MDKEQFEYRNCAGLDRTSERLPQSRQKKLHGIFDGMVMTPRQIKKGY